MTTPRHFIFEQDFGKAGQAALMPSAIEREKAELQAAAHAQGYAQGVAAGRAAFQQEMDQRLHAALESVGYRASEVMNALDQIEQAASHDAIQFAGLFARTAAANALEKFPLADLELAARETLAHVRQAPHLVIRVHETLYEQAESLLKRIGRERGFEGRLVILGEPDVVLGDFSIEWADGGVARDSAAIQKTIDDMLARHMSASPAGAGN